MDAGAKGTKLCSGHHHVSCHHHISTGFGSSVEHAHARTHAHTHTRTRIRTHTPNDHHEHRINTPTTTLTPTIPQTPHLAQEDTDAALMGARVWIVLRTERSCRRKSVRCLGDNPGLPSLQAKTYHMSARAHAHARTHARTHARARTHRHLSVCENR